MSRQSAVIAVSVVLGLTVVTVWAASTSDQVVTAAFWFEDVTGDETIGFAAELGGPITGDELEQVRAIARGELRAAFAGTRLVVLDSRAARYRVRVVARLGAGPRARLPVAGASRALPGRRGDGAVSFPVLASSAIAYAPPTATRDTIIAAIGRGIGRSAAHELAHQILREFPLDSSPDRLSYEYADLRPEHFYGEVRWSIAGAELEHVLGRKIPVRIVPGQPRAVS